MRLLHHYFFLIQTGVHWNVVIPLAVAYDKVYLSVSAPVGANPSWFQMGDLLVSRIQIRAGCQNVKYWHGEPCLHVSVCLLHRWCVVLNQHDCAVILMCDTLSARFPFLSLKDGDMLKWLNWRLRNLDMSLPLPWRHEINCKRGMWLLCGFILID